MQIILSGSSYMGEGRRSVNLRRLPGIGREADETPDRLERVETCCIALLFVFTVIRLGIHPAQSFLQAGLLSKSGMRHVSQVNVQLYRGGSCPKKYNPVV